MSKVKLSTSGERVIIELTPWQVSRLLEALPGTLPQDIAALPEKLADIISEFDLDSDD